jgi:hypothetical protein
VPLLESVQDQLTGLNEPQRAALVDEGLASELVSWAAKVVCHFCLGGNEQRLAEAASAVISSLSEMNLARSRVFPSVTWSEVTAAVVCLLEGASADSAVVGRCADGWLATLCTVLTSQPPEDSERKPRARSEASVVAAAMLRVGARGSAGTRTDSPFGQDYVACAAFCRLCSTFLKIATAQATALVEALLSAGAVEAAVGALSRSGI